MNDYIYLTDFIRNRIKTERTKRKIGSVAFSRDVMKLSNSFISHIENGVTKKMERKDIEKLFSNILGISGEELEKYILELLVESERLSENSIEQIYETIEPIKDDIVIYRYDEKNKLLTKQIYKEMVGNIISMFNVIFKEDPKYAFDSIGQLMENLQFDTGFTLALNNIPFEIFKDTDHEIRQQLFDEISGVFDKYAKKYVKGNNNESEEEFEEKE